MKNPEFRTKVVPNFYQHAHLLRQRYDDFFGNPSQATYDRHFKLNYWFVPTCYTYIRSHAQDIIGHDHFDLFQQHLVQHAVSLGFGHVTPPLLSIYVNGCYQSTHSDMMNGSIAYVYSLTRWDTRKFDGGETLVAKDRIFDKLEPREHRGWSSYWESYPGHFNQLLLFDDRLAHAVVPISGPMDPLEARIVMHGHIY